ncbi:hypothetical protein INT47_003281 [Mucor saturninus]|uniref:DNA-directed RNA polymerase III subunit RPC3 n=1 Tax=Mucor saturninus TaxID=64648 RepID=A0A8H7RFM8_9FUNG|nr:hypothetical protein INT47_003281 [Mucor saturninus]
MSTEARLCKKILLEDFGVYTARIGYLLITKGRLTIPDLTRFSSYSLKCIRETLVTLIHHGIVYFNEGTDDKKEATFYEIDTNKVLMRLRMARIMRVTEEHYGKSNQGSSICQLLFLNGRVKLSQVAKWATEKEKDEGAYTRTFTKMAIEQFVTAVLPQHSRSVYDRFLDAEEKELEKYTIVSSAQEIRTIKSAAQATVNAIFKNIEHIGMKRKAVDDLQSEAKRMQNEGYMLENEEPKRSTELAFDVDPEMVADFATSRINRTAGIVMKTFFRSGKEKMKVVKEDTSPAATVTHIANMLEPDVFTRGDIVLPTNPMDKKEKPSVNEVVQGYVDLLRTDPSGFIKRRDELGSNQFSVNFARLRQAMKKELLEGLVTDKFGVACCRIVRILNDKGKLDESQIQKYAMLPPKDVRQKLDTLLLSGLVEIQEVPRSTDRAPGRSFHLWYVPLEKCFQELLVDVYRTTANLQQRKTEELLRRKRLIDKLSREDVIANIELLGEIDKAELAKMEKVIERIEVSKGRLDEMSMILRDF